MPFSVRLDPGTEARLRQLAISTGRSKSWVLREAVMQFGATEKAASMGMPSALDRVASFAGVVSTGGQYSTDTHSKFRDALERKHPGRRSR